MGAGKQAQVEGKHAVIAEGIAKSINDEVPNDQKRLIVHFKASRHMPDMIKEIRQGVRNPDRLSFVHWGKHTATNDYSDIKHVFLAGVLQYSTPEYEATGIAAKGSKIEEPLSENEFRSVRLGK